MSMQANTVPLARLVKTACMWGIGIIWMIPIVGIFFASVRPSEELVHGWWNLAPLSMSLDNYIKVLFTSTIPLIRPLKNSLFLSLMGTFIAMFLGSLAGYGLARYKIPLKTQLVVVLISTMSVPFQMLAIPVFKIMNFLSLLNSLYSVMIMHVVTALPWITFFIMNFMQTQNSSIEECAKIDGCSQFGVFFRIVLPNLYPALLAVFALQFVWSWIDFFFPLLFLYTPDTYTAIQVIPLLRGHFVANWGELSAASVVVIFFPFVIFFLLQKYYIISAAGWQGNK